MGYGSVHGHAIGQGMKSKCEKPALDRSSTGFY